MFKSVNMFLESVLSEADTAALHSYPDDLERQDPLSVDKIMLNPDSQYVHRLLALVQVLKYICRPAFNIMSGEP